MTSETLLPDPTRDIEGAFEAVAERMRGLAFFNPALRVQAVDFQPWEGHWLGVLVSPWSINLMLTPGNRSAWQPVRAGSKRRLSFPAGEFEFIDALDPSIGEYRMCSLFSPAMEFEDHAAAELVARLALRALFDVRLDQPEVPSAADSADAVITHVAGQAGRPLSKRDFLHGRFLRSGEPDGHGR